MTDSSSPRQPAFRGAVKALRTGNALILTGAAADRPDETLILTFIDPRPADLPERLSAAAVDAIDAHRYRVRSGSSDWMVEAGSLHVHRDVSAAFHAALAPRPAPLRKRLFWRLVLMLAATRGGKRLLLRLRGG